MLNCPRCNTSETKPKMEEVVGGRLNVTMWCPICQWAFEVLVPATQAMLDAIKASFENEPAAKS